MEINFKEDYTTKEWKEARERLVKALKAICVRKYGPELYNIKRILDGRKLIIESWIMPMVFTPETRTLKVHNKVTRNATGYATIDDLVAIEQAIIEWYNREVDVFAVS